MYREHFEEHPEEYENINAIKLQTKLYEIEREKRKEEKLRKIEEARKFLYGDSEQ